MTITPWLEFVQRVGTWVEGQLGQPDLTRGMRPFVVNDALWGSVRMTAVERALVDTPLMQRLRKIRQLGPATLVYPSASHSRFDHAIGACNRAATVMAALTEAARQRVDTAGLLVPREDLEKWTPVVRVGALLHDVGHVFCSHAGERCLTVYGVPGVQDNMDALVEAAYRALDCEKQLSLSELLSYAIISSEALAAFCAPLHLNKADLQLIAGAVIRSREKVPAVRRWIADLLSGPLDVDKQDYVPRDAMMAGVGVQVEPHRCAEVLRVCSFQGATIANSPDTKIDSSDSRVAITFSGISVLEDILLSRMSLFLRLYRHHKVRVAERLLERAYELVVRTNSLAHVSSADLPGILALTDASFFEGELRRQADRDLAGLSARDDELKAALKRGGPEAQTKRLELEATQERTDELRLLRSVLWMLEVRDLPIRAFAYGKLFPHADLAFHSKASEPWDRLAQVVFKREARDRLEARIVSVAIKLGELTGSALTRDEQTALRAGTFVDLPKVTNIDLAQVFIYPRASEKSLLAYEKLFQPNQWLDALQDPKLICYVYAPRLYSHLVHAAAEHVFAEQFQAMAQELRRSYSRCSFDDVSDLKEKLHQNRATALAAVPGIERILDPPSFLPKRVAEAALRLETFMRRGDALIRENPHLAAKFLRVYESDASVAVGISIDIVGSSKYAARLQGIAGEAEVRSALLEILQEVALRTLQAEHVGVLPLKTAGDEVVAIGAVHENHQLELIERALECIRGNVWRTRVAEYQDSRGWPREDLGLRITLVKGDIEWAPQLRDLLGQDVTAMFTTADAVKKALITHEAAVALLGEWPVADGASFEATRATSVSNPKVRNGEEVPLHVIKS
ncbi:MAG: hypothetical protein HYV09_21865 [Deltaproteobacteria bacterium]|nr:hypothetical protein [Deltaproteobacteria bacterium]